ncbi:MFS transporter [Hyphomonas johnsonii]|uniref:Major facilitator superfamily protein n=1 Tax=Hyphomonas johnsonii MHS-2 TaxID=1280950 RepID=A0A059FUY0_9PROT|nr:MFS transporter [Hyphomonas johnsonii]KCZ94258.1 major facilitator superfamily protein [Hyphomonas johnsonii MHS-2]
MSGTKEGDAESKPIFSWGLILPLLFVTALNPLNSAMLATALAPIGEAYPGQEEIGGWLVASLYLTAAISQPVLGSFADRFGARRVLVWTTVVLGLGAMVGALAQGFATLIISRILIGFGTSSAFPCAVAIIRHRASRAAIEPPAKLLGYLAAASSVAVAAGPPLGGFVTEWIGWRGVFSINLPFAVVALTMIFLTIPPSDTNSRDKKMVDWPGIALFTVAMTSLVFFLMHLTERVDVIALTATLLGTACFVLYETQRLHPFVDFGLLRKNRSLTLTYGNHAAFNFANYCYFYSMPQWAHTTLGHPLATSGFLLMPVALAAFMGSLVPTRGRRGCIAEFAGAISLVASSTALLFVDANTSIIFVLALSFGFGICFGTLNMSNQQRLLDYAPVEQSGSAAGLLRTSAYLGAMLSAPLVGYLMASNGKEFGMAGLAMVMVPVAIVPLLTVIMDLRHGRHTLKTHQS